MSHRSYRPVLPTGNKLLQKKWDQTYYDEHRRLVHTAKPMVDTRAPRVHPHVTSKWKKQQVERERAEEIERDNHSLLTKMQRIMSTQGSVEHRNTYRHHSLNDLQRQRDLERVAAENKQMLLRLQKVEPMYKVSDWVDSWMQKEELKERITAYPSRLSSASRPKAKTLPPAAARGTSASPRPRMAKTTSVGATRGSKVDHHPRKTKSKELGNSEETVSDVKEEEGEMEAGEEGQTEKAGDEPEVKVEDEGMKNADSEG